MVLNTVLNKLDESQPAKCPKCLTFANWFYFKTHTNLVSFAGISQHQDGADGSDIALWNTLNTFIQQSQCHSRWSIDGAKKPSFARVPTSPPAGTILGSES